MEKRTFTKYEKLAIIKEVSGQGIKATLEKYKIFLASYFPGIRSLKKWEKMDSRMGITPDN